MKPLIILLACAAALVAADDQDHPSGKRTTPPALESVSPLGMPRGITTELTLEGLNLASANAIYFSEPGIKGKILRVKELPDGSDIRLGSNGTLSTVDLGPLPPRNQVTVEVDIPADAKIGPVGFSLQTPLGTTAERRFLVEPFYGETADREPNNGPEDAVETFLPTILAGTISKPGDVDYYKIHVKAGEEFTFENGGSLIGSQLQPVVTILAEDQSVVHEFGTDGGMDAVWFAQRFEKAGVYYIRVADYAQSGKSNNFYRLKVGHFPLVTRAYPLGLQAGRHAEIALTGWNLKSKIAVDGTPTAGYLNLALLRPQGSFNDVKLAIGAEPETESAGANRTPESAQPVTVPVTINGRLNESGSAACFRFHAAKGQKLMLEVNARRLGSDLDSFIEVLTADGKRVERATARATWDTFLTLSDRNSIDAGLRLSGWTDLKPGDLAMIGNEIIRVDVLPKGPDEDVRFEQFGGQRLAFLDTTTEAHSIDKPVYKVKIYPPGTHFSPNGLPVVPLYYQNDDGGPGYGKDSLVHFTAPEAGDYIVRLRDVEGLGGPNYPYRLTIREPRPDFRLTVSDRNPSVPAGGCIPQNVIALRMDDFDQAIAISVEGLPAGLRASKASVLPGQVSTTLLLCAAEGAKLDAAVPLKIVGRFGSLEREANPDNRLKLISLMPPPDVRMTADTREITLQQGGTGEIAVHIERRNEFGGRVQIDVRNLPPHVIVPDVGLNGILLNENETRRTFKIQAMEDAPLGEQWIYLGGDVETRSSLPSVYSAPEPVKLTITPRTDTVSSR